MILLDFFYTGKLYFKEIHFIFANLLLQLSQHWFYTCK